MKYFITLLIIITSNYIFSQVNYDVRKTKWGMTISEVIASEYPLTPSSNNSDELEYANVKLSNGHSVRILYYFKNKMLNEVRYILFGYNASYSKGTCKHIVSLYDKITYTKYVFDAVVNKGLKCDLGWYLPNCYQAKVNTVTPLGIPLGEKTCLLDKLTIDKIEKLAFDSGCDRIALSFENERTAAIFYFNQYKPIVNSLTKHMACDDIFFNIYYWLEFKPSYKLREEIQSTDF